MDARTSTSRRTLTAALLAGALVLAGCTDDPDGDAVELDGQLTEDPDGDGAPDLDDGEALSPEDLLEAFGVALGDGLARGFGVVLPIPDGYEMDPGAATQGALFASLAASPEAEPDGLLLAIAGLEQDPFSGFEGNDLETALEVVRSSVDQAPDRDEPVTIDGAVAAHLLEYRELSTDLDGAPDTYQALILAIDAEGGLALFNYVAALGSEDGAVVDLLIARAAFDPDSEPLPPLEDDGFGELDLDELDLDG